MGKEFTKLGRLLRMSALGVSALALGAMALPADAFAQDRGRNRGADSEASQPVRQAPQTSRGDRGNRSWNGNRGANDRGQRSEWRNRGERAEAHRRNTGQSWGRGGNVAAPAAPAAPVRAGRQDQGQVVPQRTVRNRTYADPERNRSYRDGRRDDNWRNRQTWRDNNQRNDSWRDRRDQNRDDWRNRQTWRDNDQRNDSWRNRRDHDRSDWRDRDGRRWSGDQNRRWDNHRNWDRRWRDNNRYDWYRYRNSHRHVYRLGRYYAPYQNYYYRRVSIGFFLNSLFYSNRYWIDDPWQYRLPPAYGPYRWIRYYDDALLVDIYTGEVVDVIHSFFW